MNNVKHPDRYRICNGCWISDDDLSLAMQDMTTASIKYILKRGLMILKERKQANG